MNILVCIKQVPDTTEIKIDPVTNTLIREGVPSIVNPFDAYALEVAARIKDKDPSTTITVVSMGPEQAKAALKECLSVGADKAFLASDRAFGGSDTLATSYVISCVIKKLEETEGKFDLIFFGKQAIDGDTAQVGPEVAEHIGYPQVTYAVEAAVENGSVRIKKETEEGFEVVEVQTPAVVTVTKTAFDPRYPSIKSKMAANKKEIPTITAADLDIDTTQCGLKGSPTKVKKTFVPVRNTEGVIIKEETNEASATKLFGLMVDAKLI